MNKFYSILALLIVLTVSCSQSPKSLKKKKSLSSTYMLPTPQGWTTESFTVPPSFASGLTFKGAEDIRFSPGWGKSGNSQYWSYAFLWVLEDSPAVNADIITNYLGSYYTGLASSNMPKNNISKTNVEAKAQIVKTITGKDDLETYKGTVNILDYMKAEPITLNCVIHVRNCPGNSNKYIFHELSPKEQTDSIWRSLDQIWDEFQCN